MGNRCHIFRGHICDYHTSYFNFVLTETDWVGILHASVSTVRDAVPNVVRKENIDLGYILDELKNGHCRYYFPGDNCSVLKTQMRIDRSEV